MTSTLLLGKFDTVLQNPPFGVQKRTADRRFLEKALKVADAVYSLHNHPVTDKRLLTKLKVSGGQPLQVEASPFLQKFVEEHGGQSGSCLRFTFGYSKNV